MNKLSILLSIFFLIQSCSFNSALEHKKIYHYKIGSKYFLEQDWINAKKHLIKAYKLDYQSKPAIEKIGTTYFHLEDYDKSIYFLLKLKGNLPSHIAFYIAQSYRYKGDYSDAIYYYKKALEKDPKNKDSLEGLAWSYYNIKYFKGALKIAEQLKTSKSNDIESLLLLSKIYNKVRQYQKSEYILKTAEYYADEASRPYVLSAKGQLNFYQGKLSKAKSNFLKALKIEPLLESALLYYGKCLLLDRSNPKKGMEMIKRAIRLNPTLTEGYFLLIKNKKYLNSQDIAKLKKKFKNLATLDPEFLNYLKE